MASLLRRGDRNIAVADVRARLGQIGFAVDSDEPEFFDDRMDEAVRSFQQARGLVVDGIVGPNTLARLEEARWRLGDRPLSFQPGHLLHGDDVISLQQRLTSMGFDTGKVDGIFGNRTEQALREFQRSVGEEVDGIAGTATFQALNRLARTVTGGRSERLRQSMLLDSLRTGIANKTVVIDPGHGGDDAGVTVDAVTENTIVSAVARRLQGKLAALGATVVLTRPLNQQRTESDRERADLANEVQADLVLSIHCNASVSPAAAGITTFHFGSESGGWSHAGERAGQRIHAAVLAVSGAVDCGMHARSFDILRLTRMAAVQVEIGYLTNPAEKARLEDARYQEILAQGLAAGVVRFFEPAS